MPAESLDDWDEDDVQFTDFELGSNVDNAAGGVHDQDDDAIELPHDGIGHALFNDGDDSEDESEIHLGYEASALPEVWRDGDGLDQHVITQHIRNRVPTATDDLAAYKEMAEKPLSLSRLRQIYESHDERAAVELLKNKWKIRINPEFIVPHDSPNHQWASVGIHLDYRFAMGNSIGLYAAMPNTSIPEVANDPDWVFRFSTTSRFKVFRGSRTPFGCEVAGRMLMIGHTPANEEVFIVLVDPDTLRSPLPDEPIVGSKRSTCMRPQLARAMLAMLAHMMKRSHYRSVSLSGSGYPSLDSDAAFSANTTILEKPQWDITLREMIAVNNALIADYATWVRKAPAEYKALTELRNLIPVAVVVRYGQNRQIENGEAVVEVANKRYWERAVDYSRLREMQVALAQHLRYSPVDHWGPTPRQDIIRKHPGPLYSSEERRPEHLINDLKNYKLHDDNGVEQPLFDQHGQRITRVVAKYLDGQPRCCGILQKLNDLDGLFDNDDDEEESADEVNYMLDEDNGRGGYINDEDEAGIPRPRPRPRFPALRYDAYPHALLPNHGQWQAHGVISSFDKLLRPITHNTRRHVGGGVVVEPVSSQCYNTFAHKTRENARLHIAQRGLLTATVSGAWATTPKGNTTFQRLFMQSDTTLPHLRLESQVQGIEETYLRFENVLRIYCDRMKPESLSGSGFYQQVYPNVYLWTSYPIVTLLKSFWTFYAQPSLQTRYEDIPGLNSRSVRNSSVQRLSETPDHYVLEMIAVLERLLNFCHTGLAKALTHTLMKRLWPTRAVLDGYYPFFWPGLSFSSAAPTRPVLNLARWPLDIKTGKPLCASLRSQEFTYGAAHVETYRAHFQIRCLMARTANVNNGDVSLLSVLCGLVMDAFISDVIGLVAVTIDEIKSTLKENPSHPDVQWMRTRCAKFKLWRATEQPLNYGDEYATLDLLTQAVSETLRDSGKSLPKSALGKCSVRDFVERLYAIGMGATQQSITAPVWAEGSTPYTLRLVLAEAHRQLGLDTPLDERADMIKFSLRAAVIDKEIHFFPDHGGDRTRRPSITKWTFMGQSDVDAHGGPGRGLSQEARVARDFLRHADAQQRGDVMAEWSINEVTLGQYGNYMTRERLPSEWTFKKATEITSNEFNHKVYKWAEKRFTQEPQHWQCRLAMALAFLHTTALPKVHMDHGTFAAAKPFVARFDKITERSAAHSIDIARKMPLHEKNKNGFRKRGIYFTMASTVYLGWIDPTSPIHKELKKSPTTSLPTDWTKKHTAKGFTVPILLRFGIVESWGSVVLYSPKKGEHFRVHSQDDLKKWEDQVSKLFMKGPQGAYRLAELILGAEDAERLDEAGQFPGMQKRSAPLLEPQRPPPNQRASGSRLAGHSGSSSSGSRSRNAGTASTRQRK
ncbi:hypothetical protein LXA43DRAFT_1102094 [Ganoderma leucocontextum]|nr:hypothetical protein LXA43DRAFT_1102094 [Ganoderma leucocontextum]